MAGQKAYKEENQMEAYQNAALSPEERAKDLLGRMTLKEKVGQLNQRLYGFRIYERQGEEFTLTDEFKEEVERMGGLGELLYCKIRHSRRKSGHSKRNARTRRNGRFEKLVDAIGWITIFIINFLDGGFHCIA